MVQELLESYNDNPEAQDLIRVINYTSDSVFLTGKAGTGKSTLLKSLIKGISKKYIILAPTGIAALNIEGQTLHSFFQFEPRPYLPYDKDLAELPKKHDILNKLDLIIIDEISMVRCDLMNAIDLSLRKNLKSNLPFAGKQLLVIGDLFQLPPVVDNRKVEEVKILEASYKTPYFFSALAFEKGFRYYVIELEKVYRQKDESFISLLNGVRENMVQPHHLVKLNQRYNPDYIPSSSQFEIVLATTNEIARQTNDKEIRKLEGRLCDFHATVTGVFLRERLESKLPADRILQIKEDAQIMFIKNDQEKRWVNGSIGKIVSISSDSLRVKLDSNNQVHEVQKVTWESYEYAWNKEEEKIEKKINGEFTQFPVKLAWAVTIHKSQGQSFDKIIIDLGRGAFAAGQTYVALSRCRSFEGITLKSKVNYRDIKIDERVNEFLNLQNKAEMERKVFESILSGMQLKINQLDSSNSLLVNKVQKIEQLNKQLQQSELYSNSVLNNTENLLKKKEIVLSSMIQEANKYKSDIEKLSQSVSNQKYYIFAILAACIFFLYKWISAN